MDLLIALAHGAGAPDNVACVVADVVEEAVTA
jgi:serine/threonine protein phosphatase PrpC